MPIQIRPYMERDLEMLVVLLNAINATDQMEEGTSLEEKREYLAAPETIPQENAFVAEEDGGRLVAFGTVRLNKDEGMNGFRARLETHPMYRGRGLEDRLLTRLQQRAMERIGESTTPKVYFACAGHTADEEKLHALERAGMHEIRRFWVMLRPELNNVPTPRFQDGLIVRTLQLGQDDEKARDALNDSFSEHFGFAPETTESFQWYLHLPLYRPDLTVLAIDPTYNRIVGFCHIVINEGECQRLGRKRGWIDILGVREEYRHKGLGEALILQGMHNLRSAGMTEAALGCDSENTTNATALYFRTGFEVIKTNIVYEKLIREPSPQDEREPAVAG